MKASLPAKPVGIPLENHQPAPSLSLGFVQSLVRAFIEVVEVGVLLRDGAAHGNARAAVSGLQGWIDCFERAEFGGSLFCGGLNTPGEAAASTDALERAYDFGKALK